MQRFNGKKFNTKMETVSVIVNIIALVFFAILCFVVANYQPIEYEEAIPFSAQFEKYYTRYRYKGGSTEYIEFINKESKPLSDLYFFGDQSPKAGLEALPKGTTLDLKLHPGGDVLEIKAGDKEILNFDYAQKQLQKRSIFILVIGILSCAGIIPCVIYVWKKIVREKVFSRAVQFYK